jgi:hypothetical protein
MAAMTHSDIHSHQSHHGAHVPAPGSGAAGTHHHHAPSTPHPAQVAPWSMLRQSLAGRLGLAVILSAALWGLVWLAMRPA